MPKRTLKRKKASRARAIGFRARSKNRKGRRVLKRRRRVGRKRLVAS